MKYIIFKLNTHKYVQNVVSRFVSHKLDSPAFLYTTMDWVCLNNKRNGSSDVMGELVVIAMGSNLYTWLTYASEFPDYSFMIQLVHCEPCKLRFNQSNFGTNHECVYYLLLIIFT